MPMPMAMAPVAAVVTLAAAMAAGAAVAERPLAALAEMAGLAAAEATTDSADGEDLIISACLEVRAPGSVVPFSCGPAE